MPYKHEAPASVFRDRHDVIHSLALHACVGTLLPTRPRAKKVPTVTTRVTLTVDGPVARVLFQADNGIQLLGPQTRQRLAGALDELEAASGISVVVFEALGRVFIAGADINELRSLNEDTAYENSREGQALMNRVAALPATTIAAIHGACAGGGCELSLACDMRLATQNVRIGLPETGIGIIPGWGGTVRAPRILGSAAARRLILTGELVDAATALQLGLIDAVADDEPTLRSLVDARVATILSRGPGARALAKSLITEFEGPPPDAQFEQEARAFAACYRTSEPDSGMTAFLEKKSPDWPVAT
ncbi:enoyl-CoA hydratase [bacterium]|nr:enoyl-CoA hydratase [bacterium]